ncbi:ubiquitin-associated protein 2-like [Geospiza fortis]|uniref:Ubiquitin-associated protein 2-like n=1 Tax=Geospiza fortis TaxID=48883 RepID=A0A8N5I537_GEOFO|nr:ubiquitin-associated protein 2-like [Geospiza fortis]
MMTSVVSERTRGTRDKMQISTSQPTQPQKQVVQATAEQIRLAQMIYDKNDTDFEDKVKQLMEVTGKNQDECIVALHDCNGDVNRAINILLEGSSDTTSWETVGGKKKNLGKESLENKENREKQGDREISRGWGSSNRWGRGGSRGREFRTEENGVENSQGDRPSDRGKRSRGRDLKSQPQPSPVLIHMTQRQQQQTQTAPVPPPGLESFSQEVTAHQTQQKQLKPPKRRITPASKIPASAVEMPGSADVTGLNVQFGAMEFGSEPTLTEFGSTSSSENTSQATNNSLYSKSVNDPLNTSLPISNTVQESTYTTSAVSSSSVTCSSQSTSPVTTSSYEQTSVLSRIVYESSMAPSEPTPVAVTNGHNSVRTQATLDTTSSVPVLKTEPSPSLPSAGSLPSMVSTTASLLPSASQHAGTLSSLPQSSDLASSSHSQLSSSLSNHQSSLSPASVLSSSTSHVHTSVENTTSLQPSTTFSTASTSATSTTSSVVSMASSMNTTASLGLSVTSVSATTRAAPLMSSGKAPPNLPQGLSPLLHNQYIVGPGGLLPAYPIYGYDDLQMLQSRLPMMVIFACASWQQMQVSCRRESK